jgi:hypothetical protein
MADRAGDDHAHAYDGCMRSSGWWVGR